MYRFIQGDARSIPLGNESVQVCITSPPYFGLRNYNVEGQIGLEPSLDEYVQQLVMSFREVKRILRNDGVVFLNLGDSYFGSWGNYSGGGRGKGGQRAIDVGSMPLSKAYEGTEKTRPATSLPQSGLKNKDLCGVPWRVAFALQADGWYLRSDIIWAKPNPMPESVRDRPTKAHEYIFMLTKSEKYYWDQEAVKEPSVKEQTATRGKKMYGDGGRNRNGQGESTLGPGRGDGGRNVRTVWNIATQPFAGSHFATFPRELVKRCVLAGTSEKGSCSGCGSPWKRVTDRVKASYTPCEGKYVEIHIQQNKGRTRGQSGGMPRDLVTASGWAPSCSCNADVVPSVVLDPFSGAGTTVLVSHLMGRSGIGVELNPAYITMSEERITNEKPAKVVKTRLPEPETPHYSWIDQCLNDMPDLDATYETGIAAEPATSQDQTLTYEMGA